MGTLELGAVFDAHAAWFRARFDRSTPGIDERIDASRGFGRSVGYCAMWSNDDKRQRRGSGIDSSRRPRGIDTWVSATPFLEPADPMEGFSLFPATTTVADTPSLNETRNPRLSWRSSGESKRASRPSSRPYSEDGEPPFMQEWSQADIELEVLGRTCVSMLSDSLEALLPDLGRRVYGSSRPARNASGANSARVSYRATLLASVKLLRSRGKTVPAA